MTVEVKFTLETARRLHDATTNKSGLHVVFVAHDLAMSAASWTGPCGMDADLGVQLSRGKAAPELPPIVESVQACVGSNDRKRNYQVSARRWRADITAAARPEA
jgi:hypothetical protein